LSVICVEVGLGLIFDPRYRDFPFAPLSAAAAPFLVLALLGTRGAAPRGLAETVTAIVLAGSAVYIVLHEGFANWQALWLSAVLGGLSLALLRARDAPG
jgi:glucan 1,3-beta-glucosidase